MKTIRFLAHTGLKAPWEPACQKAEDFLTEFTAFHRSFFEFPQILSDFLGQRAFKQIEVHVELFFCPGKQSPPVGSGPDRAGPSKRVEGLTLGRGGYYT
jgi:hypothetical protein